MLKGIDPRLNAEVLYALRAMGHGDVLIVADTNFPSASITGETVLGDLLRMDNLTAAEAIEAILSVYPLDTFVDDFAGRMEIVDAADEVPPVQQEVQTVIDAAEGQPRPMIGIPRSFAATISGLSSEMAEERTTVFAPSIAAGSWPIETGTPSSRRRWNVAPATMSEPDTSRPWA